MRGLLIALVMGSLVSAAGPAEAQGWTSLATLEPSQGSVAAWVGSSWGSGTLTYQGHKYRVKVQGLSVGEVGITWATAKGTVSLKVAASGIRLTLGPVIGLPT